MHVVQRAALLRYTAPRNIMTIKTFRPLIATAAGVALLGTAALAQAPASQGQTMAPPPQQTIQQQNEEIIKELRAIRQLLERLTQPQPSAPPQPTSAKVTNLKGYALGKADAPLTMVEFTDLQCPFCRQFVISTFDQLKKDWIDTGKLRYISRDFPLDFHAQAMNAARAARCAGDQDKFWEMRLALMRNANLLTPAYITKTAGDLKLDMASFTPCAVSNKYDAEIQSEMAEGTRMGVTGTPTFVMGRSAPDGISGPMVVGALPYSLFDAKLKELLTTPDKPVR
jgi:protein-disulfide isomerase